MSWISAASRRLSVPNDEAWAVISDPARTHEWLPCHEKWIDAPATPPRRGHSVTQQVTAFGAVHLIRWTVTEWTAPSIYQFSAAIPDLLIFSYGAQVQPVDGASSRITLRTRLSGSILRQLRTDQLRSATGAELDRAVTMLDQLLRRTDRRSAA